MAADCRARGIGLEYDATKEMSRSLSASAWTWTLPSSVRLCGASRFEKTRRRFASLSPWRTKYSRVSVLGSASRGRLTLEEQLEEQLDQPGWIGALQAVAAGQLA